MSSKKSLIAQIGQNLADKPSQPPPSQAPNTMRGTSARESRVTASIKAGKVGVPVPPSVPPPASAFNGSGKQATLWLNNEDRAIFNETALLLLSQGIKPSDNVVVRAAIRLMPRDHRLVEQVRELMESDGRKLRHTRNSK